MNKFAVIDNLYLNFYIVMFWNQDRLVLKNTLSKELCHSAENT